MSRSAVKFQIDAKFIDALLHRLIIVPMIKEIINTHIDNRVLVKLLLKQEVPHAEGFTLIGLLSSLGKCLPNFREISVSNPVISALPIFLKL